MTVTDANSEEEECNEDIGGPCETCGKRIENALDSYSHLIINSQDHVSVDEMIFCCRKCWEDYLVKKAKEIK